MNKNFLTSAPKLFICEKKRQKTCIWFKFIRITDTLVMCVCVKLQPTNYLIGELLNRLQQHEIWAILLKRRSLSDSNNVHIERGFFMLILNVIELNLVFWRIFFLYKLIKNIDIYSYYNINSIRHINFFKSKSNLGIYVLIINSFFNIHIPILFFHIYINCYFVGIKT